MLGTPSFPALQSLTIDISRNLEAMKKLLLPSHFPSLRALCLNTATATSLLGVSEHHPCRPFFKQLDALFISNKALSSTLIKHQSLLDKTLVHVNSSLSGVETDLAFKVHHVCLRTLNFRQFAKVLREAENCNLRTLYLPRLPEAAFPNKATNTSDYEALLSVCRERKLEVILEEEPEVWGLYAVVSSEFRRRQRLLRRSG